MDLSTLPQPQARPVGLRLNDHAEARLRRGHPWIYADGVRRVSHAGQPGDCAVIYDKRDRFLAVGLYDPASVIRARMLQWKAQRRLDAAFFAERLQAASDLRRSLASEATNGYRVAHGENDGLPGLVVDRYADIAVIKLYTAAWIPWLRMWAEVLSERLAISSLVLRLSRAALETSPWPVAECLLWGKKLPEPAVFKENGLRFEVDPLKGQKTGFFLDQRENRARLEGLCAGKEVLNVFSYTGGFSVYAARGGARSVLDVDASRPALEASMRNFALNAKETSRCRHETLSGDAFEVLGRLSRERASFDVIVIDPPAFAKSEAEVPRALESYARLARIGIRLLRPGGEWVMASCSSRVSEEDFFKAVMRAAAAEGRRLKVHERTGHPADHPVGIPEGAYLKCLFARAD